MKALSSLRRKVRPIRIRTLLVAVEMAAPPSRPGGKLLGLPMNPERTRKHEKTTPCELTGGACGESSLKQAFLYRMQSPGYQNGSDGANYCTASSRVNMLRDVQSQFKDRAFRQVQNEFPALREALIADRQNKVDVRTGKTPRNAMEKTLDLSK